MLGFRLFLLGLISSLLGAGSAAWAQPARPRTLAVRGTASAEVQPEHVELFVTYRVADNAKDAGKAKAQEQALLVVLQSFGVPREKLVLNDLSSYGYRGSFRTYHTNVSLSKVYRLTLEKPAVLNELFPRVAQAGADHVSVARLASTQLETRKQQVLAQALNNARQKVEGLARQLGQGLGAVVSVTEGVPLRLLSADELLARKMRAGLDEQSAGDPPLSLRTIPTSSAVHVQFELK